MMRLIPTLCLVLAGTAAAEIPPGETHDGLFVRVGMGPKYGFGLADGRKGGGLQTHGYSAGFDIQIGFSHFENFALHGDVAFTRIVGRKLGSKPTQDIEIDSFTNNLDYRLLALGLGATWWLPPRNIYLTVGIGYARLSVQDDGQQASRDDTAIGFRLNTMVGREWYFYKDLSIGIGGQFTWSLAVDRAATWNILGFGLVVTAAYN